MMDGLLCHCRADPDGHAPGSVLDCEAPVVREGNYPSRSGTRPMTPTQYPAIGPAEAWHPSSSGDLYDALARAASTPAERKRWREHARMLRDARKALRSRPEPCIHCTPLRCSCARRKGAA